MKAWMGRVTQLEAGRPVGRRKEIHLGSKG
jgi:hypothetical protein